MRRKQKPCNIPEILTVKQAAKLLGITLCTLRRWDAELKPFTTPGGHRRYYRSNVEGFVIDKQIATLRKAIEELQRERHTVGFDPDTCELIVIEKNGESV